MIKSLPTQEILLNCHPKLYNISVFLDPNTNPQNLAPNALNLSSEKIDRTCVYLLDNGRYWLMYIPHSVPPTFFQTVFNVESFDHLDPNITKLPGIDTPQSKQLRSFMREKQPLTLIKEGDIKEKYFFSLFVEDKARNSPSYYEFLITLNNAVQSKLKKPITKKLKFNKFYHYLN